MAKKCSCGKCAECKAAMKKSSSKTAAPKNAKLAAMYGDKNKITRGDVITAAKMKKGNKK
jgi:hypothetical protein